jgi:hypothetical protein
MVECEGVTRERIESCDALVLQLLLCRPLQKSRAKCNLRLPRDTRVSGSTRAPLHA